MPKGGAICSLIDMASEMVRNGNSDPLAFQKRMLDEYGLNLDSGSADSAMERAKENVVKGLSETERRALDADKELADYVESLRNSSGTEFIQSGIKAGLLSGLSSIQASLFGNMVSVASELATRPVAALIDHAAAKLTGQRSVTTAGLSKFTEIVSKRSAEAAAQTFLHGAPEGDMTDKWQQRRVNYQPLDDEGKGRYVNHVTRAASWAINKVFDSLAAADKPARRAALIAGLHEAAVLRAMNEGLDSHRDIENRVAELLGPSPDPSLILGFIADQADKYPPIREVLTDAKLYEDVVVFANDSSATRIASSLSSPDFAGGWIGTLVLPFPKIPTNVALRALEHTPLGILYGGGKLKKAYDLAKADEVGQSRREQRKASMAIARSLTGTGLIYMGYLAAKAGMVSEPTPQDQTERELFYASGRQGSSLKVGNRWLGLRDYPQLFALFVGAQIARSEDMAAAKGNEAGAGEAFASGALAAVSQVQDMPTMQGFEAIIDSVDDVQRGLESDQKLSSVLWGTSFARNLAGMVVPKVVRDIGQLAHADPYQRAASTPGEQIGADNPFTRMQAPAKVDALGRPVETGPGRLLRGLSANQEERQSDPVAQELYRLGARTRMPSKSSTKDAFKDAGGPTPPESVHQERVSSSGRALLDALSPAINSDYYKQAKDTERRKFVGKIAEDSRSGSTKQFKNKVQLEQRQK